VNEMLANFCHSYSNKNYIVTLINPHYKEDLYQKDIILEGAALKEEVKHSRSDK
jgi:hypothetical protein